MTSPARYHAFPFVVRDGARDVAGFSAVSGLQHAPGGVDYRGDQGSASTRRVAMAHTTTEVTLHRGVTDDDAFRRWLLAAVAGSADDTPDTLTARTRTLVLALRDDTGREVVQFELFGCWARAMTAPATGSGATDALAIESLVLQVEGFTRVA